MRERERERYLWLQGLPWLRGVQILIPALGDHCLQGCGGCEKYRYLYPHWEAIGCRVAVVARSTDNYTRTGRPLVAGLRWLREVQILIPALGDHWLQGCGGCEKYRYLYPHWETIGCRVAVVARSTDTYTRTGRPLVVGLRWLRGAQIIIPALGDLWLQGCGGCEKYRYLYPHWETIGCRVAVVARSTDTYTRTGRPLVVGLRWLREVQILIPALGDHWL